MHPTTTATTELSSEGKQVRLADTPAQRKCAAIYWSVVMKGTLVRYQQIALLPQCSISLTSKVLKDILIKHSRNCILVQTPRPGFFMPLDYTDMKNISDLPRTGIFFPISLDNQQLREDMFLNTGEMDIIILEAHVGPARREALLMDEGRFCNCA